MNSAVNSTIKLKTSIDQLKVPLNQFFCTTAVLHVLSDNLQTDDEGAPLNLTAAFSTIDHGIQLQHRVLMALHFNDSSIKLNRVNIGCTSTIQAGNH